MENAPPGGVYSRALNDTAFQADLKYNPDGPRLLINKAAVF